MPVAREGLELLLRRDYPAMEQFLGRLGEESPDSALGTLGWMAYYQVRNLENYDFRFDAAYLPWHQKGREWARRVLAREGTTAWDELIAGGILGLSGFYYAHNHHWLLGLRDGVTGVHAMERAYRRDPSLADALLGSGLYDYWRSHYTRLLSFLPFFPDRRGEGREKIADSQTKGSFVGSVAHLSLAFIDLQEKRYDRVLVATGTFLERYPANVVARMLLGATLLRAGRYREASGQFERVLAADPTLTKCHLFVGLGLAREGRNKAGAERSLRRYLAEEPRAPAHWRRQAVKALEELKKGVRSSVASNFTFTGTDQMIG